MATTDFKESLIKQATYCRGKSDKSKQVSANLHDSTAATGISVSYIIYMYMYWEEGRIDLIT